MTTANQNFIHTRRVIIAFVLGVVVIGSSACRSGPSRTATATVAQDVAQNSESIDADAGTSSVELGALDILHASEARDLLQQLGDHVWPGWGQTPPPFLLRKGDFDYLIGHPSPPKGFEPLPNTSVQGQAVYREQGHLTPRPVATAWEVGGVWSVALPTYEEFQYAIIELLGPGMVELNDVNFIRTLAHEAFHAYQFTQMGGIEGLPHFVQAVDEAQALEQLAQESALDAYHSALGETLRAGIEAETDAGARQAAAQFLELRREWRAGQPEGIATFEQSTEWVEGLARYADTRLLFLASRSAYEAHSSLVEQNVIEAYPEPDETWQSFLDQLAEPAQIPGGLRDRYYVLGAGEGFLLDRLMSGWKAQAMPGGATLEGLLEQALADSGSRSPHQAVKTSRADISEVRVPENERAWICRRQVGRLQTWIMSLSDM
jgi:hypothetical protein